MGHSGLIGRSAYPKPQLFLPMDIFGMLIDGPSEAQSRNGCQDGRHRGWGPITHSQTPVDKYNSGFRIVSLAHIHSSVHLSVCSGYWETGGPAGPKLFQNLT